MLTKYAVATIERVITPTREITAAEVKEDTKYQPPEHLVFTPDNVYTLVRAISARVNKNWDGFPRNEIQGAITDLEGQAWEHPNDKYGYPTFRGKNNHIDHYNQPALAATNHRHHPRGLILDATYHEASLDEVPRLTARNLEDPVAKEAGCDAWVRLLIANNRNAFPRLCEAIELGAKDPTRGLSKVSMGCEVLGSWCSVCGNFSRHEYEYCKHVTAGRGSSFPAEALSPYVQNGLVRLGDHIPAFEKNHGLVFFEESWITDEQADPTASLLEIVRNEEPRVAGLIQTAEPDGRGGPAVRVNLDGKDIKERTESQPRTRDTSETDDEDREMDYSIPPDEQPGEWEPSYPFPCSALQRASEAPENADYPFNVYIDVDKCEGCMYNDTDNVGAVDCNFPNIVREGGKDPLPPGFEPPEEDDDLQPSGFRNEDGTDIQFMPGMERKSSTFDSRIQWVDGD